MIQHKNLKSIGQVAVFYLPVDKLHTRHARTGQFVEGYVHTFLINNYDAYTYERGNSHGFWRRGQGAPVYHDTTARFEVSFGGKEKIPAFIDFLEEIRAVIGEEAIYLTMGKRSYLIVAKETDEVRKEV